MKNIVITGTSRGIGFEMVRIFSEMGHRVLALSRNEEPILAQQLENVHAFSFDITSSEAISRVSSFVAENWGSVHVLINNAGALVNKAFEELSLADFRKSYEVNVFGVAEVTRVLLPFMEANSHVVNISSMGGVQGSMKFPGLAAYSSSKGALITLTELLAEEYKDGGPSFNVLALGAVQTEMLQEAFPGYEAPVTATQMGEYIVNFSLNGHKFYNGKIMQVSNSTP
ncbi:SDR family NAD(P)-dependent oxidoreductase [Christiangramia flava]|uniref:Oxidoreductase, short-chain dehydrogenase/reductase family n=1 Tax=Christiangramia flava JLT2011 TaxID=1229726 RepID=A0A1L7I1S7_9FLAO|nr:SDR family oxidoreductase [Christiangramia flava]APU67560.1 Oxidoreductase, short-chain dehydrogenase/reductase family [Christiangramia flava JLT2011]OSS40146.1 Oxidoreductase, short-chain dehydrogenase/reductase family [Christiangramia flava JLT2011]